ncbi:hypothetical protein KI387_020170, partial [Taxus chinensis]
AREALHMRDVIPELLETILLDVTNADWRHLELARLGGFRYYRQVPRDVELLRELGTNGGLGIARHDFLVRTGDDDHPPMRTI